MLTTLTCHESQSARIAVVRSRRCAMRSCCSVWLVLFLVLPLFESFREQAAPRRDSLSVGRTRTFQSFSSSGKEIATTYLALVVISPYLLIIVAQLSLSKFVRCFAMTLNNAKVSPSARTIALLISKGLRTGFAEDDEIDSEPITAELRIRYAGLARGESGSTNARELCRADAATRRRSKLTPLQVFFLMPL